MPVTCIVLPQTRTRPQGTKQALVLFGWTSPNQTDIRWEGKLQRNFWEQKLLLLGAGQSETAKGREEPVACLGVLSTSKGTA